MKHKKSLLALAAFSIFTGVGLATANTYAAEYETIVKTINCDTTTYKVDQDYDSSIHVIFQDSENCGSGGTLTFDLNGKTIADGTFLTPDVYNFDVIMQDSVGGGSMKNLGRHGGGPDDMIISHSSPKTLTIKSGVYDGIIDLNGGQATIENGVFSGSINALGTNALDIVDGVFNGITFSSPSSATILGGSFNGETTVQSGVNLSILGGNFSGNLTAADGAMINVDNASTRIITVPDKLTITGGTFSGDFGMQGNGEVNINSGTYTGSIAVTSAMKMYINGGNFVGALHGSNITISGGTFSTKPDEKYLNPGYTFYEVDGKYIVDRNFMLTNFFQYMYVGQTNDAYISPAIISKTAKVTSSDENIVGVSCEDSKKLVGQMLIESEDISSKACVITAKKAGEAVLSYTTDYGYEGNITVRVADIDATDYGNDADKAKYELTARYLSVFIADPVEHAWYSTAPSAVGSDYGTYLENLKKQFAGLVSAIDAGHKIKLKLDIKEVPVTDGDKELVGKAVVYKNGEGPVPVTSANIAAAYTATGSILDISDNKTLVEDWAYGTSRFPIPEILKNRQRTIQIMPVRENTEENQYVYAQDAKIEDGYIVVENMVFDAGNKFVILYDGSVINPDGTTEDVPSVPNSAGFSDENSMAIILGASVALGLIIAVIAIYANGRKKALNKVRF